MLACCARPSTFGTTRFGDLERSVRSGDLLLYNDPALDCESDAERATRARAVALTRLLFAGPCVAHHLWHNEPVPRFLEQYETNVAANRPLLESHWLEWQHAALVVCVKPPTPACAKSSEDDSLESAPKSLSLGVPHVFVPAWGSMCHAPAEREQRRGEFVLQPLRAFLNGLAQSGERCCALRHMLIADECEREVSALQQHLTSARRANLRDRIDGFQRTVFQMARKRPDSQRMSKSVTRAVDKTTNEQVQELRAAGAAQSRPERDVLLLMRASTAYLVLHTLFSAQVLRVEPRIADARQLVQADGALGKHLANDYQFSDERVFSFERTEPAQT